MFAGLFRPRWQHKDPEIRRQAVIGLSIRDPEQAKTLALLARGDSDPSVRACACQQLTDMALLDQVIQHDACAEVKDAASLQVKELLAGNIEQGPSLENRLRLIGLTDNQSVLAHVALHSKDPACSSMAVERLSDQTLLCELALSAPLEETRVAACAAVRDETVLRQIIKSASAKRLQRQARDQLKALQQGQRDQQALEQKQAQLLEQLSWLQSHPQDPLFEGRLTQAIQHWQELHDAAPELAAELKDQLEACQALYDQRQAALLAQEQEKAALQEQEQTVQQLESLRDGLKEEDWNRWQQLRAAVETQVNRWQAACEACPPNTPLEKQYQALLADWRHALALADQDSTESAQNWPAGFPLPAALKPKPETSEPASPAADTGIQEQARKIIRQLDQALRQRQLKRANRSWQRLDELLAKAGDRNQWDSILSRREQQLAELRDWHQFAAQPKKELLCRDMESLAESPLDPEEQAGAIQALHDAWKELMSADQDADQELWDRFKQASDQAWEPCRAHHQALDAQRAENLARRTELVSQLENFIASINWEQADWPAVLELRQTAPKEWQTHQPVRFTDAREVNRRFSDCLAELDKKLDQEDQQHCQILESLIDKASQLPGEHNPFDAANQCKGLQQQWKQAGWVRPKHYHKLHRRFRKEADRIFKLRDNQQQQQREAQNQAIDALKAQADSIGEILKQGRSELDTSALREQMTALQDAIRSSDIRSTPKSIKQCLDAAQSLLARQPQWRRWQSLKEQITAVPVGEANLATQRQLAVAFEVAADVASPADAQQERTEWQLSRLSNAMTAGTSEPALKQCLNHWQNTTPEQLQQPVRERLLVALAALEPD